MIKHKFRLKKKRDKKESISLVERKQKFVQLNKVYIYIPFVQPTVQRIPSGERTRPVITRGNENMERGRVVNRHVAPRTNTVSSFREVSEGAGNAGLHRAPWTCTYALAGLQGQIVAEIGDDLERTKVERNRTRFIETKIFEKKKRRKIILMTRTRILFLFYFCCLFFSFPSWIRLD